jgi:hypothetical protein
MSFDSIVSHDQKYKSASDQFLLKGRNVPCILSTYYAYPVSALKVHCALFNFHRNPVK